MKGAVAVDLGASSGRFATGRLVDGRIEFEIIKQVSHAPFERKGVLYWDFEALLRLCSEAVEYAASHFSEPTLGIDTWGVDHGFIDPEGNLIQEPVCYRDLSHVRAFEELTPHRRRLYELTGCQHQPFNTICQLYARGFDNWKGATWMILPDLLGYMLAKAHSGAGRVNHELTQASTTQLLGIDGKWSREAFEIAGWPVPDQEPALPGTLGMEVGSGVRLAYVGSHDTASAVCGFGNLAPDQAFLNVGTWSLIGRVIPHPITSEEAEAAGFSNERTIDGQVRFLKNIPGFYVINRIHEELEITASVPQWLAGSSQVTERVDLLHEDLYNPASMIETCASIAGRRPESESEWAGLAMASLTHTIAQQPRLLEELTGHPIRSLRVGGGGSQSAEFCQSLANESRLEVIAGPAEATVLGNLAMQMLASRELDSYEQMRSAIDRSTATKTYLPD